MNFLLPLLAGGISSALGAGAAGAQTAIEKQQADLQQQEYNRRMQEYEQFYSPLLKQQVVPALLGRMQNPPAYAGAQLALARSKMRPWNVQI